MKAVISIVGLLCVACAGSQKPGPRQQRREPPRTAQLPPKIQSAVSTTSAIGRKIFEKDKIAAISSDMLLKEGAFNRFPDFKGWLVHDNANGYTASYYHGELESLRVLADIVFVNRQAPQMAMTPERTPTPEEIAIIKARTVALQAGINGCSNRFNTVVLPGPAGKYHVYVLAATTKHGKIVVGGHSRVTVSHNGENVEEVMPYSKSCLDLDSTGQDLPEGATLQAMMVTHLVSPIPSPTHVYLSLLHNKPLMVLTETGIWAVEGGTIRFMGRPE